MKFYNMLQYEINTGKDSSKVIKQLQELQAGEMPSASLIRDVVYISRIGDEPDLKYDDTITKDMSWKDVMKIVGDASKSLAEEFSVEEK